MSPSSTTNGAFDGYQWLNAMFEFDLNMNSWKMIEQVYVELVSLQGYSIPLSYFQYWGIDRNKLYMYGGYSCSEWLVYMLHIISKWIISWKWIAPIGLYECKVLFGDAGQLE